MFAQSMTRNHIVLAWALAAAVAVAAVDTPTIASAHLGPSTMQWQDDQLTQPSLRRGAHDVCRGGNCNGDTVHTFYNESSLFVELLTIPERLYNRISVDVTYNNVWEEFFTFPERKPRIFNVVLATAKTWLADLIVQLGQRRSLGDEWKFDWNRSAAFAAFGFLYVGCVGWFFYVSVFTILCPNAITFANAPIHEKLLDRAGQIDLFKQVFFDNFLIDTLIYFPVFYIIKEVIYFNSFKCSAVSSGLMKYKKNFREDNVAGWAVWIPTDFLIYAAPMFLRMPLDHGVSFLWTMLLSYMRGRTERVKSPN